MHESKLIAMKDKSENSNHVEIVLEALLKEIYRYWYKINQGSYDHGLEYCGEK